MDGPNEHRAILDAPQLRQSSGGMANPARLGWTSEEPGSSGYINRAVVKLLRCADCTTVLDAGCGNGNLAGDLERHGYSVTGIDADADGVRIARAHCSGAIFHVGTFETEIGEFDAVVSTEVVEHLYDPDLFARFCWKSLKPGGHLIVTTPYHGYFKNLAIAIFGGWDRHFTARWHGGHIKFWSRATLTGLLEDAGFRVMAFRGLGRCWPLWKSMAIVAVRPSLMGKIKP